MRLLFGARSLPTYRSGSYLTSRHLAIQDSPADKPVWGTGSDVYYIPLRSEKGQDREISRKSRDQEDQDQDQQTEIISPPC